MAGRHSQSSGRRGISLPVVAGVLLLVAACTAGVLAFVSQQGSSHNAGGSGCDGKVTIHLDAAPSIADPVQAIATKWLATGPKAAGQCIGVDVNSLPAANVEQILASGGNGAGGNTAASLWIPDSSTWATRLDDDLSGSGSANKIEIHAPIASSPLVFVSSPKVVSSFPSKPDWNAALAGSFPLTIPNPVSNTDGLLSLQIMNGLVGSNAQGPDPKLANLMLRLSHSTLADANSGFAQLAADPAHAQVFTAPEQAVIQANRAKQSLFAAAIYPDEGTLSMDYPVVRLVRSGDDPALTAALDAFEQQLRSPTAQAYFADAGFRNAGGASVPGVGAAEGVAAAPIRQMGKPSSGQGVDTLRLWEAVTDDVNTLTADRHVRIDGRVGGQRPQQDPADRVGRRGRRSELLPRLVAGRHVGRSPRRQTPTAAWTQLVPIGEMSQPIGNVTRRQALVAAARRAADPGQARQHPALRQPARRGQQRSRTTTTRPRSNTVVLMTDGQNENPGGLTLDQLLGA